MSAKHNLPEEDRAGAAPAIERVEPPCWWVGMKTPLQLMLYGSHLEGCSVRACAEGVEVTAVHRAQSPSYLFVNVAIAPDAPAGRCEFVVEGAEGSVRFDYDIAPRRRDSAQRESFGPADLVYLIMPDRFAEGDRSIRSTEDTREQVDRSDPGARHGGDLQGIADHLDYLSRLGVTTLWIAPVLLDDEPEGSYHGYACADYYRVDPRYGDNELYRRLVEQAHRASMKVIMDVVLNHCGTAHWWMKDLPFEGWIHQHERFERSTYRLASLTDPHASQDDLRRTLDGWFDASMPDIALENPYVLQYFVQVFVWWIEWADLDGLRVDTFPYNDRHAAAEWTRRILEEYPRLRIVAECWHSSAAVVAYWDGAAHNHDGYRSWLPSVMDFPLQEAIGKALESDKTDWSSGMNVVYESLALDFLYADARNLLIFLDNHDIGRFADSVRGNADKIKLGLTMLATLRGIPQLYYGTEYGFRSTDPAKGDMAARIDFPGGWQGDRKNLFTGKGGSAEEREIFEHARRLFNWRKGARAVHEGKMTHYLPDDGLYVYCRRAGSEAVLVVLNPTPHAQRIDWNRYRECIEGFSSGVNVLDGRRIAFGRRVSVPARTGWVLELEREQ